MAGKRPLCFYEVIAYSSVLFFTLFTVLIRQFFVSSVLIGLFLGAAASLVPAGVMHLACMYDPVHVLKLHYSPVVLFALLGVFVCRLKVRKQDKQRADTL
jgi:hypothetical protein